MGRATPPSCTRCHPSNSGKGDLDSIRAFRQKNLVCTRKGLTFRTCAPRGGERNVIACFLACVPHFFLFSQIQAKLCSRGAGRHVCERSKAVRVVRVPLRAAWRGSPWRGPRRCWEGAALPAAYGLSNHSLTDRGVLFSWLRSSGECFLSLCKAMVWPSSYGSSTQQPSALGAAVVTTSGQEGALSEACVVASHRKTAGGHKKYSRSS